GASGAGGALGAVTVSPISSSTFEVGTPTATFTVVLATTPTADVTLTLESSDDTEGTASPATLTFTPVNWNAPQTVAVTGVDDDVKDGNQAYSIQFTGVTSDDPAYSGLSIAPVAVTNVDNETAAITVEAITGQTTEAGGQATFSVTLTSEPKGDVTIGLSSSDTSEGTVSPSSLVFTAANWNSPHVATVTGTNDSSDDGPQDYQIVLAPAVSTDQDYHGLVGSPVTVRNIDDETAGFTVTPLQLITCEVNEPAIATFTVRLNSLPSADVTIDVLSGDTTEGTLAPASLRFTTANWAAPQTVTVTRVDDEIADGNQVYAVAWKAATSADDHYQGLVPPTVSVTNTDNETAGFVVSTVDNSTTEAGAQGEVTLRLTSQPSDNVVVGYTSSDTTEGVAEGSGTLTFTPINWAAPQSVTVTGQNDPNADGNQSYSLVFAAATSSDAQYQGLVPTAASLTNEDDETAGFTVVPTTGATSETGTQFTFTVALNTPPLADVTVAFGTNDPSEGIADRSSLTLTAANWNAPQPVIVTGQDDDLSDGNQSYAIVFSTTTSTDPTYAAIAPNNVVLTNTDQGDTPGITVSNISNNTSEDLTTATFTVVLDSEPFADAIVNVDSADPSEGRLDKRKLTFTPANWDAPQTVTVRGQNDDQADGNQKYAIVFGATESGDPDYDGVTPAQLTLSNTDNDTPGFVVSAVNANTSEHGVQQSFSVRLASQPFSDVSLPLSSSDPSEGTLAVSSLEFTTLNWAAPQTVTITGVDDNVIDGDQPYTIDFQGATSTDTAYKGLKPTHSVELRNIDNDTAGFEVESLDLATNEAGDTGNFRIRLILAPTEDVALPFNTSDLGEGVPSATSVTFTAADWSAWHNVVVTGQDDDMADGDQAYQIVFEP
ncbi:hypothetical protein ACFL5O_11525, partial [Myxococcota bacterium]